jgi:hypothetical protein
VCLCMCVHVSCVYPCVCVSYLCVCVSKFVLQSLPQGGKKKVCQKEKRVLEFVLQGLPQGEKSLTTRFFSFYLSLFFPCPLPPFFVSVACRLVAGREHDEKIAQGLNNNTQSLNQHPTNTQSTHQATHSLSATPFPPPPSSHNKNTYTRERESKACVSKSARMLSVTPAVSLI